MSFSYSGDVVIRAVAGEYSEAVIPCEAEEVDPYYFCGSCMKLISEVSDDGYVLADVHDLNDVQLYKVEVGAGYKIGNMSVTVTWDESTSRILVRSMPAKADE